MIEAFLIMGSNKKAIGKFVNLELENLTLF